MSQPKMEGGELVHFMSAGTTALQQQPPSLHFMPAPATAIHVTNPLSPSDGSLMWHAAAEQGAGEPTRESICT